MKDNTDPLVAVEGEDRVKNIPDDGSSISEKDRKWQGHLRARLVFSFL